MPRFSRFGAASVGVFGFGAASRPAIMTVDYLVVGGGGTAGYPLTAGGGGRVLWATVTLSTRISYDVVAGDVASASTFYGTVANPGSPGGSITPSTDGWGGNGGSGGSSPGYSGGNGTHATYWDGSSVRGEGYGGGGAAGAGGAGGDAWTDNPYGWYTYGGAGGPGLVWPIDGKSYGAGRGGAIMDTTAGDRGGPSGSQTGVYGFSGTGGGVIISYKWPRRLYSNGSVHTTGTGSNLRWFHAFSAGGDTTLVPYYF